MKSMKEVLPVSSLEEIRQRAMIMRDRTASSNNIQESSSSCEYGCIDGLIINYETNTATFCVCRTQKMLLSRIQSAMIPEEFEDAEFDNYQVKTQTQAGMLRTIQEYLQAFEEIKDTRHNSFGFVAAFGEQKLREIRDSAKRSQLKAKHNNFGLGKTHLQIAASKELINRGHAVLCVSDVAFMDELSKARVYGDEGERVNKLLGGAIHAPILVWDDIGKAKPSEYRLDMYYQIINERYKAKRPIIFSSNEDQETMTERIGDAAASRILGMARGRVFAVEGSDFRLSGQ